MPAAAIMRSVPKLHEKSDRSTRMMIPRTITRDKTMKPLINGRYLNRKTPVSNSSVSACSRVSSVPKHSVQVNDTNVKKIPMSKLEQAAEALKNTERVKSFINGDSLKREQINCFLEMICILEELGRCGNVSAMGEGKTVMICHVAKYLNLPIFAITPPGIISQWKSEIAKWGAQSIDVISFTTLRGKNTSNSPYIMRDGTDYYPSDKLKDIINKGCLLVIDEFHFAKNHSRLLQKAYSSITKLFKCSNDSNACPPHPSRLIIASATPSMNLSQHAEMYPRLLGIVTRKDWIKSIDDSDSSVKTTPSGLKQLYDFCKNIDSETTINISGTTSMKYNDSNGIHHIRTNNVMEIVNNLVSKVLIPNICTATKITKTSSLKHIENRFYVPDKSQSKRLQDAYGNLLKAKGACIASGNYSELGKVYDIYDMETEPIRAEEVATEIIRLHKKFPMVKFLVLFWYHESVQKLQSLLEGINRNKSSVAVLNGTIKSDAKKQEIKKKFQEDNDDVFVLIAHPTMCVGSNLDDTRGNRPRIAFMSPHNRADVKFQSNGRIDRFETKSHNYTINVYFDEIPHEMKIHENYVASIENLGIATGNMYPIEFPKNVVYERDGKFNPTFDP